MAAAQLEQDPVGLAVCGLRNQSVGAEALTPAVAGAVGEFEKLGFAELVHDPARAGDRCRDMSVAFDDICRQRGIQAEVVRGAFSCELTLFPGNLITLAVHVAVQVQAPHGEALAVDWTARQFEGDAPVPLIVPVAAWRQVWAALTD